MKQLPLSQVSTLCMQALTSPRIALNQPSAAAITKVIVAAERDGSKSHGLFRLPGYCAGILHNKVNPNSQPVVTDAAPGSVLVDAQYGYAPLAFERGLPMLVDKAKTNGCAVMAIKHSFHFAALWFEAECLAEEKLASIACVNSKSYVAQPNGSGRRLYGTNPMAFGYPRTDQQHPLIIDQASGAMARGEIMMHEGDLPTGVGIDEQGRSTQQVDKVLKGAQLPFGGQKGANVALMIEILAAGMTGSPFAYQAHEEDVDWYGPTCHGEFIIAMDPSVMGGGGGGGGSSHVEDLFARLLEDGGRIPGGRRHSVRKDVAVDDIYITETLYDEIHGIIKGADNVTQGY